MLARRIPFFKLLAILKFLLLMHHHWKKLDRAEEKRMRELVKRGRKLSKAEREELRALAAKLEPAEFMKGAAARLAPLKAAGRKHRPKIAGWKK